jgi:hypothetical protein
MNTYEASGHFVYYRNPVTNNRELFLTIHPTSSDITEEQQACYIAQLFNLLPYGDFGKRILSDSAVWPASAIADDA